jgi:prevent-host-death family protein
MAQARKTLFDPGDAGWKLQDAKARFSELVRCAQTEGPQRVTVRGHQAVVVIAAEELARLLPPAGDTVPFVTFMESLSVDGLDLTRERDQPRWTTISICDEERASTPS